MENVKVVKDLPKDIKELFIQELELLNYTLEDDQPIGSGAYGFVYKAATNFGDQLTAFKVIRIPKAIEGDERLLLLKSINEEVIVEKS